LRFRKYSEPFIRGCFGDLIFLRKEKYDPQKNNATYPCIELENIEQETCLLNGYFNSKNQKSMKTKFQSGDVLFGKLRPYLRKYTLVDFNGVCSTEIWALYSDKLLNSYLFYYIQTEQFLEVANTSSGTKMPRAEWNLISSKEFRYPQSREEMGYVSHFLSKIDQRIETQSKIIEKLQSQMKGICNRIFARSKTKKLEDCLICKSSTLLEAQVEMMTNGDYAVYGATGIIKFINTFENDKEAILILKDGANVGKVQYADAYHSVIGTSNYFFPKAGINLKYIYYALLAFDFQKFKVGSGIPHIYFKDYKDEKIYFPPDDEQQQIIKLLSCIEQKISVESTLLDKLKEQKKFLLSNMFI